MLTREQVEVGLALLREERVVRRRGREETLPPAVVREGERYMLADAYLAERDIARHLRRLMAGARDALALPKDAFSFTPDASQLAAAETAMAAGVLVLTGGPGCVASDTRISVKRTDGSEGVLTIQDAFTQRKRIASVRALVDGKLAYHEVKDVLYNGVRKAYRVRTTNHDIVATDDHPFKVSGKHAHADDEGYVQVRNLHVGSRVVVADGDDVTDEEVVGSYFAGERPVYDLVMADPHRNYVADGFVVHNCGKTTVTRAIIAGYEAAGLDVVCCAPTGKAALRMSEQTGHKAATIHSTIGLVPGQRPLHDDGPVETHNGRTRGGPIAAGALVLDEASMCEARLMAALLRAVPTGARLLIVGDADQLPSIGAGRVLSDIIVSGVVPCVRLTKIHRQASESRIPYVARDINSGRVPANLHVTGTDFTHWETHFEGDVADRIVRAVADPEQSISVRRGIPLEQVQVLAPQYKGVAGVENLNAQLQAALNPVETPFVYGGRGYSLRAGDRVIHVHNNYDLAVMNGEIGTVVACDPEGLPFDASVHWTGKEADEADEADAADDVGDKSAPPRAWAPPRVLIVAFGSRRVAYTAHEARELELGYCITVHKAQGSQFGAVIVTLTAQSTYTLTRPLLYTAVTRAEKLCLTVGTEAQLAAAARNTRGTARRTRLVARLTDTDARE